MFRVRDRGDRRRTVCCAGCGWRSGASPAAIRSRRRVSIPCRRARSSADAARPIHGKTRFSRHLLCRSSCSRCTRRTSRRSRPAATECRLRPPPAAPGATPAVRRPRTPAHDCCRAGERRRCSCRRPSRRSSPTRPRATSSSRPTTFARCSRPQGATLTSWKLKQYRDIGRRSRSSSCRTDVPGTCPRPFTLATDDPALSQTLAHGAVSSRAPTDSSLGSDARHADASNTRDASGLQRAQDVLLPAGGQAVRPERRGVGRRAAARREPVTLAWGPALGLGYDARTDRGACPLRAVQHPRRQGRAPDGGEARPSRRSYEGAAPLRRRRGSLLPDGGAAGHRARRASSTSRSTLPVPGNDRRARPATFISFSASERRRAVTRDDDAVLHRAEGLRHAARGRRRSSSRAIDFGMFAWLVVPLLQALKWINGFVGNYGWSIIVLTILINLADLPASPPQHGVDEEDAGAPAGDQRRSRIATRSTRSPIPSARR